VDFYSLPGEELVARLRKLHLAPTDADAALALRLLLDWDFWLGTESVGGSVYQVTMRTLVENLVKPALGDELFARFLGGRGPHRLLASTSEFFGHSTVTAFAMLDDSASPWVAEAGGLEALMTRSLGEAVAWLREKLGPEPQGWQWGKLHQLTAPHALSLRKPLDEVFDNGPYPIGGDTDTVCQTAFVPDAPYHPDACAPSYREIVDLGDLEGTVHIAPPGNSGVVGDPHYSDLLPMWLKGEYLPALWSREAVEREAVERLKLVP
jgi:penicillin amidase